MCPKLIHDSLKELNYGDECWSPGCPGIIETVSIWRDQLLERYQVQQPVIKKIKQNNFFFDSSSSSSSSSTFSSDEQETRKAESRTKTEGMYTKNAIDENVNCEEKWTCSPPDLPNVRPLIKSDNSYMIVSKTKHSKNTKLQKQPSQSKYQKISLLDLQQLSSSSNSFSRSSNFIKSSTWSSSSSPFSTHTSSSSSLLQTGLLCSSSSSSSSSTSKLRFSLEDHVCTSFCSDQYSTLPLPLKGWTVSQTPTCLLAVYPLPREICIHSFLHRFGTYGQVAIQTCIDLSQEYKMALVEYNSIFESSCAKCLESKNLKISRYLPDGQQESCLLNVEYVEEVIPV